MTEAKKIIINLRPVLIADAKLLMEWRNDSETIKASINDTKVSEKSHLSWLTKLLNDRSRHLFIAEENGFAVGTVKAEFKDDSCELSWTVAPHARGKGFGKKMVEKASNNIQCPIFAKIKETNTASIQIAKHIGLTFQKKEGEILYYTKGIKTNS